MHVALLEIEGFRGVRRARLPLKEHTVLIGANNAGKSTVVDALALLLGRERLVRELADYDFHGGDPGEASRIKLTATLIGFDGDDPAAYPDWFNAAEGAVPVWWDQSSTSVEPEKADGRRLAAQIRFAARLDLETLEVETIRYFLDADIDPFEGGQCVRVRMRHLKAIGFFLLPSRRTWDRVLSFSSDLFKRVLNVQEAIPADAIMEVRDSLRTPVVRIEEVGTLATIVERINAELRAYVGDNEANLTFRPTSGDIPGVLAAMTPHLPGKGSVQLPLGRHGSGVVSMQTLLLLMEIGRIRRERGENFRHSERFSGWEARSARRARSLPTGGFGAHVIAAGYGAATPNRVAGRACA